MIKSTTDGVSYHHEAVPEETLVSRRVRVLTYVRDSCHIQLCQRKAIMTSRFRGVFYRPEGGDPVAKGRVSVVVERCKACGFCVEFCPTHVLALSSAFNSKGYHPPHVVHPEKCSGCDLCGSYCPDFAIYATKVTPAGGGDQ